MTHTLAILTGTRADWSKLAPLARTAAQACSVHVFATGMHLDGSYGMTVHEVERDCRDLRNVVVSRIVNGTGPADMVHPMAEVAKGLQVAWQFVKAEALLVHGDRPEAFGGAAFCTLTGTRLVHVEGGEESGCVDQYVRYIISRAAHLHLVSNDDARVRLLQMGEDDWRIHVIGCPRIDVIKHAPRPGIEAVRARYSLPWERWGICIWHPDTILDDTEQRRQARAVADALLDSALNWIVCEPNSDRGSDIVRDEFRRLRNKKTVRVLPTLRDEFFLAALDHADCIIGNSSTGIREAPSLGTPTLNIGGRETFRSHNPHIVHVDAKRDEILTGIARARCRRPPIVEEFGDGRACWRFSELLARESFWTTPLDKRAGRVEVAA